MVPIHVLFCPRTALPSQPNSLEQARRNPACSLSLQENLFLANATVLILNAHEDFWKSFQEKSHTPKYFTC